MQAGTRFTYPGWMEGRVDLIVPRPGVELYDLSITSPTPNRCTTKTTVDIKYRVRTEEEQLPYHASPESYRKTKQMRSVIFLIKLL